MMITVCNNKLCNNPEGKCSAGCIKNGVAEYCPCGSLYCPWEPNISIVPIPVHHCKGGRYEATHHSMQMR